MITRFVVPVLLTATSAAGVADEFISAAPAGAGNGSTGERRAVATAVAASSRTAKAVKAAKAFKASLSPSQRAAMQFSFGSSKKRSGWSNLPTTFVARNGIVLAGVHQHSIERDVKTDYGAGT